MVTRETPVYLSPAQFVSRELRRRIAEGKYLPNSHLPSERDLSEEFSLSRRYVRQALEDLARDGLIVRRQGRGTQVTASEKRAPRIGILCRWFQRSMEARHMLDGVTDGLERRGYPRDLIGYGTDPAAIRAERHRQNLIPTHDLSKLPEQYEALLLLEVADPAMKQLALTLEAKKYPVVVANIEDSFSGAGVRVNHSDVMRRAVETLFAFGHRRIGLVIREPDKYFYGRALDGYLRALADVDLPVDKTLICVTERTDAISAYNSARPLLARSDRPTAIVAARDILACGVCQAIADANLVVGHDVSVIGYDDVSWPCEQPFLTTFHEPCYEMGKIAAEMLIERLTLGWRPAEQREIEAPLILRKSAGPAPDSSAGRKPGATVAIETTSP